MVVFLPNHSCNFFAYVPVRSADAHASLLMQSTRSHTLHTCEDNNPFTQSPNLSRASFRSSDDVRLLFCL